MPIFASMNPANLWPQGQKLVGMFCGDNTVENKDAPMKHQQKKAPDNLHKRTMVNVAFRLARTETTHYGMVLKAE